MYKKKWFGKLTASALVCLVVIAAILIGIFYFNFISRKIYEDSTDHLSEVYGQVNRSFGAFVERNWGILYSWSDSAALNGADESTVPEFISREREYWGFSEFYFISADGKCVTADGTAGSMDLGKDWDILTLQGEPVMAGETLSDGQEIIVFAVPVPHAEYNGFGFDAIAISYTNADMANSLNVDSFSGKAKCFVIHNDGRVLISTQTGGNVFGNYLTYLNAAADLDESDLARIKNDWENGSAGLLQCKIGDVDYCIQYQPVGYQGYILLSAVPQNVVSAGFLSVQKITMNVLVIIFLLLGAALFTLLLLRSRKQSRKSETELQYRERIFDVLSNSVDDIFIMLDSENHNVDYISPNIERLLGIPVSEARDNIKVLEKCSPGGNVVIPKEEFAKIPLEGNKNWEYEYVHQHTGERRWYRMTVYNMVIRDIKKYIIVMSDRTLEQQMNQKMREALNAATSANEAKSNFLSNMSHDIRTPMNAIVGFSVLLEKDAENPDKVREYTRKITASSHHLLSLINDVLDMSKIESGKTSLNVDHFSLPELLEELNIILMPQAKAKQQEFKIFVNGTPPEQLVGDKLRLNQILINLLSNAVKYTPDGGKIDMTVSELSRPAQQFVKLRFVVRDNGIGMSEEFQKKIFSPFSREISSVTNKIQGTGLGMAITKNLVDLMGGIISVESAPGKGSTFTVELIFTVPEEDESDLWFSRKVKRIFVVDDEEDVCTHVKEMMSDTGVEVEYATDGTAAINAIIDAHRHGNDFDVILLDWKMPEPDGIQTARLIRDKVGHEVPILVLTSYDWSEIETEARAAGINAFMPKPFFTSTFWHTIKPLYTPDDDVKKQDAESEAGIMKGLLFLVAEDNELNAEILTEMLKMEGADCVVASNGKQAVDMFESSEPGHFDMILMDVQMPVMNGYEATGAIRASSHPEAKTIPIAAMTANTFAEDVRDALDSGMDGHLSKPIDMSAARELVSKLVKRSGPDAENKGGDNR